MTPAYDRLLADLEAHGCRVVPNGAGSAMATCPAHEDGDPSLSIRRIEGSVLIFCHAGCDYRDVLAALGRSPRDLYDTPGKQEYVYEDRTVTRRVTASGKKFAQKISEDAKGRPALLYRLDRLRAAPEAAVYLVEGERDVLAIESLGSVATTAPMGAGNIDKCDLSPLHGRHVVAVVDRDPAGDKWATTVRALLTGRAATLRFVRAATGKDAADHIAAGHSLDDFIPYTTLSAAPDHPVEPPALASVPVPRRGVEDMDPMPEEMWTELGFARRLVASYGDQLLHVSAWRRWLVWDGTRWAHDTTGQATRWMKATARAMTAIAYAQGEKDRIKFAQRAESSGGIQGMLSLASTEPGIAVDHRDLDADPLLLNCTNGVLDLRTGELLPHDPARLITKITNAAYDPSAGGTTFTTFLEQIQPDPDMRDYLARQLGHTLEGRVIEHALSIWDGDGANGKSTLMNAVITALGDYAASADPGLLIARSFDAHPTGVADLFGVRLAVIHEVDAGRKLAEGTVKRLTGGDEVKARRMREDFWHFTPSHSFVMITNHKPVITGTDEGIWRRIKLVPFNVVVPPDQRDDHLGDKLALELSAVLTWMIEGHRAWKTRGLDAPASVIEATTTYRADSDALGRFIAERCQTTASASVLSSVLFRAWKEWTAVEGEELLATNKSFSEAVERAGYLKKRTNHGAIFRGIMLAGDHGGDGS
ncbi:phage/plasmid primase, P4 family [Nocardioides cheoyonin]|uniref:phage/plasmid primase, P4 family n=1 Tax=Nocardioides cheoyonin TaxID=3156615 RepID=UPI0032B46FFC